MPDFPRERVGKIFFDTVRIEPGQKKSLFTDVSRIGTEHTNIESAGVLPGTQTFGLMVFGVRCVGLTDEQAAAALDHLWIKLFVCGARLLDFYGPNPLMTSTEPRGFKLFRPVAIPTRGRYGVTIEADERLPQATTVRVHLDGILTREI